MKKLKVITVFTLTASLLSSVNVTYAQSHNDVVNMGQKNLALPNLSSKKNINDFTHHKYSYYGVSVDMQKDDVIKKWNKPSLQTIDKRYNSGNKSLVYGKSKNVTIDYNPSNKKVMSIDVIDKSMKYDLSKILPLYKKDFKISYRNGKKFIYNDCTIITFEKMKDHYYATEFKYLSYHSFLE